MKALILRGKFAGKEVEVSQWCNDWFMLDPSKNEDLTKEERAEIHRKPFSPTSLAFDVLGFGEIKKHKNNGTLFNEFEVRDMGGALGNYELSFKKKVRRKENDRTFLTVEQALEVVAKGNEVHTFLDGGFMLVGADWSRKAVVSLIKNADQREVGGAGCMGMGHGLVVLKKGGKTRGDLVFVKHDEEAIKKYL